MAEDKATRSAIVLQFLWKAPLTAVALVVGAIAASQAGWSAADLVVNAPLMGFVEDVVTGLILFIAFACSAATVLLVRRVARPALWIMVPVLLYSALVSGAWNGYVGDFDATRIEVIRGRFANAYAIQRMSDRARYRTCVDERIRMTEDAKAECARALHAAPGEDIPGSEHRCGVLWMFTCVRTAPEK